MRHTQTVSAYVDHLDRDPNGSIVIYKVGSRVRFNDGETGTIIQITSKGMRVKGDRGRPFTIPHPHSQNFLELI